MTKGMIKVADTANISSRNLNLECLGCAAAGRLDRQRLSPRPRLGRPHIRQQLGGPQSGGQRSVFRHREHWHNGP
jgi:hypothetical protein